MTDDIETLARAAHATEGGRLSWDETDPGEREMFRQLARRHLGLSTAPACEGIRHTELCDICDPCPFCESSHG